MNEDFTLRYAYKKEIDDWNENILRNEHQAGFLQSTAYAETKKASGWNIRYVVYESKSTAIYGYFIEKRLSVLGYLWYMPSGSLSLRHMDAIMRANKQFVRQQKLPVFLVKIEPKILDTPYAQKTLSALGLHRVSPIQAQNSTIMLDLAKDLPESLGPKARRDIRLVSKQSVEVRRLPFSDNTAHSMYELMKTVNRGKGSAFIRPYGYYRAFWRNFCKNNNGSFYFAYENNRPVVGAFIVSFGDTVTYKDGGSTPETLYNKRYSIAVQWLATKDAKARGHTSYDLCGTPPREELDNPNHPYYGIGQFKLKFKKEITEYCGCYDQVLNPFSYSIWYKLQQIIYRLHLLLYKDLFF